MDRLTIFFYLLMRDKLPTGAVAKLVEQVNEAGDSTPVYSLPDLRNLAARFAEELTDEVTREMPIADEQPQEHEVVTASG